MKMNIILLEAIFFSIFVVSLHRAIWHIHAYFITQYKYYIGIES